jgi:hypothetical protein
MKQVPKSLWPNTLMSAMEPVNFSLDSNHWQESSPMSDSPPQPLVSGLCKGTIEPLSVLDLNELIAGEWYMY